MGAWFATFLKRNDHQVIVSDRNRSAARNLARKNGFRFVEDYAQAVPLADLVILATPTKVTEGVLEQIEPHISAGSLIVEISSVKDPLKRTLQTMRRRGVAILSIHPMFGPGVKNLAGKTVLAVALPRANRNAKKFLSIFRKRGVRLIQCTLDEHDRLASILLALPHFINIAMVNALRSLGVDPNRLRETAGTTFRLQLLTAQAICQEDFGNEVSILMDNRYSLNTLTKFAEQSAATLNLIRKRSRSSMLRLLGNSRGFLERDKLFASAYTRFNAAVEASSFG